MKKKLALCFLVFALVLTCASAMAANIKDASADGNSATIEKKSNQTVEVKYKGQPGNEYVVMAVAQSGIDATAGRPTKETIGNNQNGVVVYMDQAKASGDGNVDFTIHPNLDQAKANDTYSIYISSNVANSAMTKVGSFTIEELIEIAQRFLGDVNGDKDITIADVQILLNYVIDNTRLTGDDLTAANVNKDAAKDITIADVQLLLNHVIDNAPKEAIA